jgi:hypothetical protein
VIAVISRRADEAGGQTPDRHLFSIKLSTPADWMGPRPQLGSEMPLIPIPSIAKHEFSKARGYACALCANCDRVRGDGFLNLVNSPGRNGIPTRVNRSYS